MNPRTTILHNQSHYIRPHILHQEQHLNSPGKLFDFIFNIFIFKN